jgi:small-conductance mechanosensitive channel
MNNYFERFSEDVRPLASALGVLLLSIILGLIIKYTFFALLRIYKVDTDFCLRKSIKKELDNPLAFFIPILMLSFFLPLVNLRGQLFSTLTNVIQSLVVISFCWALIKTVNVFEDYFYHHYEISKEDNYKERKVRTQLQFIKKLVIIAIVIFGFSIILLSFENVRRIGAGLLTSAGIAGIIIGLAAQKSIANLLAGFQIAFTQPIRIDDVLIVENEWGRVEEITLTYVVVKIWDERRLVLPITYFIEKPFQNWTRNSANIIGSVFIYTDYTFPVEVLRKELSILLDGHPLWDKRVAVLQVTNATERTMELRALMSAKNAGDAWDLRCFIREKMIDFVRVNHPECLPKTRALLQQRKSIDDERHIMV